MLDFVREERVYAPRIGGTKLYYMAQENFGESLAMGRDAFHKLLDDYNLKLRKKKRRVSTTNSKHNFLLYPNLIINYKPIKPNMLWVSDITYIRTEQGFGYLSLITDAYSRKIVGYKYAPTLQYHHTEEALRQAITEANNDLTGLIHHSDRGFQYCYPKYTNILKENNIKISMTQSGDPLENAIAERMNGVLKQEWINDEEYQTHEQARDRIDIIISYYNNRRPHSSIGYLTPAQASSKEGELKRFWKTRRERKEDERQRVNLLNLQLQTNEARFNIPK
ncbi:MAG: family transposase [Bacteroidetes bacterium]|nr:family transposase [Bacteroidota bacterium]